MKLRIMGTESECDYFATVVRKNVPEGFIRSISAFYPNVRKNTFSNEGRVYITFMDLPDSEIQKLTWGKAL